MAKKSMLTEVVDATRSVAGAALGAAAGAGAEVVVENAASAMSKGGQRLGAAAPRIKQAAANTVSKPVLPRKQKRSAARRKAKAVKRKVAVRKGAKKRTTRRKKR
jgi:hypothetical protein